MERTTPPFPTSALFLFSSLPKFSAPFLQFEDGQINKSKLKLNIGPKVRTSGKLVGKFTCLLGFRLHILCCLVTEPTVHFHAFFSPLSPVYSVITAVTS